MCTTDPDKSGCAVHIWCRSENIDPEASGDAGSTGNRPLKRYGIVRSASATWDAISERISPEVSAAVCKSSGGRIGIGAAQSRGDTGKILNMLSRVPKITMSHASGNNLAVAVSIAFTQSDEGVRLPGRAISSFYKSERETDLRVTYTDNIGCNSGQLSCKVSLLIDGKHCADPGPMNLEIGVGTGRSIHFPRSLVAVCSRIEGDSSQISEGEHTLSLFGYRQALVSGAGENGAGEERPYLSVVELPPTVSRSSRRYYDGVNRNVVKGSDSKKVLRPGYGFTVSIAEIPPNDGISKSNEDQEGVESKEDQEGAESKENQEGGESKDYQEGGGIKETVSEAEVEEETAHESASNSLENEDVKEKMKDKNEKAIEKPDIQISSSSSEDESSSSSSGESSDGGGF